MVDKPAVQTRRFLRNRMVCRRTGGGVSRGHAGFFARQAKEIEHEKKMDRIKLAPDTDFSQISALSIESRERLAEARPLTVGSASRIPGIRPSDIMVLTHWVENH